jgi:hypothetical protein
MRENPWKEVPSEPPYVPPSDLGRVTSHNLSILRRPNPDDERLHTELLPNPYGGDPDAPVVLLMSHPGFSEDDHIAHESSTFHAATRANLLHEPTDWPLYALNPDFQGTPAWDWWTNFTNPLARRVGAETVARRVFYLQLSPYHSKKGVIQAPSRLYTRDLLEAALARHALVVGLLAKRDWTEFVPGLAGYGRYSIWPKGRPQNAFLTPVTWG